MFDEIYWTFIDSKYYGEFTSVEDRLGLLTDNEREKLVRLVSLKLEQVQEKSISDCYSSDKLVDL